MTTTGPGILENQKQMLGTKSRLVWETDWCKSAAATMQLPSEAQRFAAIDLRIDDNCKRSPPPTPPNPHRDPDPLLGASPPSWPSLDPCGPSELLLCSCAACLWGDFSIKNTSLFGNWPKILRGTAAYEDERRAASHYRASAPGERGRGPRWRRL